MTRSAPHSHSIINEPSKLLICKVLAAASQILTVISTVNLSGTSIGAGFQAIFKKGTERDLSKSIGASTSSHSPAIVPRSESAITERASASRLAVCGGGSGSRRLHAPVAGSRSSHGCDVASASPAALSAETNCAPA